MKSVVKALNGVVGVLSFPFRSRMKGFLSALFCIVIYRKVEKCAWGITAPHIPLGAWGAIIAACGGALLALLSFLPRGRIIQIGKSSSQPTQLVSTPIGGIFASIITICMLIMFSFGFVIGFLSALSSLIDRMDYFDFVVDIVGTCIIMLSMALFGFLVTSWIPDWLDRLFFNAGNNQRAFKQSVTRLGFVMLAAGTLVQVADSVTFQKCASFGCRVEVKAAASTR